MKLIDILYLAVTNLWRRKLRTTLTILGVIIGTASVIIMIALGLGSMEQFRKNFIQNASLTEIQILSHSNVKGNGGRQLNDNSIEAFRQIPGISAVHAVLDIPLHVRIGKYEADITVKAVDRASLSGLEIDQGGIFTSETMPELVLGGSVLADFHEVGDTDRQWQRDREAPDIDWLNKEAEIRFGEKRVYRGRISGYTKAEEMSEKSYSSYMNISVAKRMMQENYKLLDSLGLKLNSYTSAVILAKDMDSVLPILEKVREMGYEAYSPTEYIEQAKKEQRRQQGQLSMIAVLSLLVSAIGIANTMLTGIMERRREIGVMKVIGLAIGKINLIFLLESAMMGLAGGMLGTLVGYIVAFLVNSSTGETVIFGMYFGEGSRLIIPLWLILAAIGISAGVGTISGIYPAWKASRMSPLEAIRGGSMIGG